MKKIAVHGPNPARQKTLFFNGFVRGAVNRAAVSACVCNYDTDIGVFHTVQVEAGKAAVP